MARLGPGNVRVADANLFPSATGTGTFSCWVRPVTAHAALSAIYSISGAPSNTSFWDVEVDGAEAFQVRCAPSTTALINGVKGNTALTLNAWNHGLVESTGSAWALWVNGVSQTLTNIGTGGGGNSGNWIGDVSPTTPRTLLMAQWFNSSVVNDCTNLDVAEVAIWNGVQLDAGEIAALAAGYAPSMIRPASLSAYWDLRRDVFDWKAYRSGQIITSTSVTPHPRIITGASPFIPLVPPTVGSGSLNILGNTPDVIAPREVNSNAISLVGAAPLPVLGLPMTTSTGSSIFAGQSVSLYNTEIPTLVPPTGSLSIDGQDIVYDASRTCIILHGSIAMLGAIPLVSGRRAPSSATVILSGINASILNPLSPVLTPTPATLTLISNRPAGRMPPTASLVLAGASSLIAHSDLMPAAGSLTATGTTAGVSAPAASLEPNSASLSLIGIASAVVNNGGLALRPSGGGIGLLGIAPGGALGFVSPDTGSCILESAAASLAVTVPSPVPALVFSWDVLESEVSPSAIRLLFSWTVIEPIPRLVFCWDVVPFELFEASSNGVQRPTASVDKIPTSEYFPKRFTVTSNLATPADLFTADLTGTGLYRVRSPHDRITLQAGLIDSTGAKRLYPVIQGGVPNDYYATLTPGKGTSQIRGRDRMVYLQDAYFARIYRNGPTPAIAAGTLLVPERNGLFLASQIAKDIVEFAGLELAWQCPDYKIHNLFEAVGRPIDILIKLVQPFSLVEARKVDIFTRGNVCYIRQRKLNPTAIPALTISAHDLRISQLGLRSFQTARIGTISLTGRRTISPVTIPRIQIPPGSILHPRGGGASLAIPNGSTFAAISAPSQKNEGIVYRADGSTFGIGIVTLPDGSTLIITDQHGQITSTPIPSGSTLSPDGTIIPPPISGEPTAVSVSTTSFYVTGDRLDMAGGGSPWGGTNTGGPSPIINPGGSGSVTTVPVGNMTVGSYRDAGSSGIGGESPILTPGSVSTSSGIVTTPIGTTMIPGTPIDSTPINDPSNPGTITTPDGTPTPITPTQAVGYTITISTESQSPTGKIVTISTYRMPDKLLLREQKDTYTRTAPRSSEDGAFGYDPGGALKLTKSEIKECTWQASIYGPNGPLNQPKQTLEVSVTYSWITVSTTNFGQPTSSTQWGLSGKIITEFSHDSRNQLTMQVMTKATANSVGLLKQTERVIKRYADQGTGWIEVASDTYAWNESKQTWSFQATDAAMASARPGGRQSGGQSGGPFVAAPIIGTFGGGTMGQENP